ncbi:putative kinesin [Diplonema papillatum]|nr:putative kinesin [Diplonema papillatum]
MKTDISVSVKAARKAIHQVEAKLYETVEDSYTKLAGFLNDLVAQNAGYIKAFEMKTDISVSVKAARKAIHQVEAKLYETVEDSYTKLAGFLNDLVAQNAGYIKAFELKTDISVSVKAARKAIHQVEAKLYETVEDSYTKLAGFLNDLVAQNAGYIKAFEMKTDISVSVKAARKAIHQVEAKLYETVEDSYTKLAGFLNDLVAQNAGYIKAFELKTDISVSVKAARKAIHQVEAKLYETVEDSYTKLAGFLNDLVAQNAGYIKAFEMKTDISVSVKAARKAIHQVEAKLYETVEDSYTKLAGFLNDLVAQNAGYIKAFEMKTDISVSVKAARKAIHQVEAKLYETVEDSYTKLAGFLNDLVAQNAGYIKAFELKTDISVSVKAARKAIHQVEAKLYETVEDSYTKLAGFLNDLVAQNAGYIKAFEMKTDISVSVKAARKAIHQVEAKLYETVEDSYTKLAGFLNDLVAQNAGYIKAFELKTDISVSVKAARKAIHQVEAKLYETVEDSYTKLAGFLNDLVAQNAGYIKAFEMKTDISVSVKAARKAIHQVEAKLYETVEDSYTKLAGFLNDLVAQNAGYIKAFELKTDISVSVKAARKAIHQVEAKLYETVEDSYTKLAGFLNDLVAQNAGYIKAFEMKTDISVSVKAARKAIHQVEAKLYETVEDSYTKLAGFLNDLVAQNAGYIKAFELKTDISVSVKAARKAIHQVEAKLYETVEDSYTKLAGFLNDLVAQNAGYIKAFEMKTDISVSVKAARKAIHQVEAKLYETVEDSYTKLAGFLNDLVAQNAGYIKAFELKTDISVSVKAARKAIHQVEAKLYETVEDSYTKLAGFLNDLVAQNAGYIKAFEMKTDISVSVKAARKAIHQVEAKLYETVEDSYTKLAGFLNDLVAQNAGYIKAFEMKTDISVSVKAARKAIHQVEAKLYETVEDSYTKLAGFLNDLVAQNAGYIKAFEMKTDISVSVKAARKAIHQVEAKLYETVEDSYTKLAGFLNDLVAQNAGYIKAFELKTDISVSVKAARKAIHQVEAKLYETVEDSYTKLAGFLNDLVAQNAGYIKAFEMKTDISVSVKAARKAIHQVEAKLYETVEDSYTKLAGFLNDLVAQNAGYIKAFELKTDISVSVKAARKAIHQVEAKLYETVEDSYTKLAGFLNDLVAQNAGYIKAFEMKTDISVSVKAARKAIHQVEAKLYETVEDSYTKLAGFLNDLVAQNAGYIKAFELKTDISVSVKAARKAIHQVEAKLYETVEDSYTKLAGFLNDLVAQNAGYIKAFEMKTDISVSVKAARKAIHQVEAKLYETVEDSYTKLAGFLNDLVAQNAGYIKAFELKTDISVSVKAARKAIHQVEAKLYETVEDSYTKLAGFLNDLVAQNAGYIKAFELKTDISVSVKAARKAIHQVEAKLYETVEDSYTKLAGFLNDLVAQNAGYIKAFEMKTDISVSVKAARKAIHQVEAKLYETVEDSYTKLAGFLNDLVAQNAGYIKAFEMKTDISVSVKAARKAIHQVEAKLYETVEDSYTKLAGFLNDLVAQNAGYIKAFEMKTDISVSVKAARKAIHQVRSGARRGLAEPSGPPPDTCVPPFLRTSAPLAAGSLVEKTRRRSPPQLRY